MATPMSQSMSAILSKHYLGEFKMRLGNITCTELVRPLSQNGLKHLERSIKDVGWLENFAPSVVIQRDRLGDSDKLTAEAALITPAHTLDGNHRVATLKNMFGEDGVFLVRVYLEFKQADERLIANGQFLIAVSAAVCLVTLCSVAGRGDSSTTCCAETCSSFYLDRVQAGSEANNNFI